MIYWLDRAFLVLWEAQNVRSRNAVYIRATAAIFQTYSARNKLWWLFATVF